MVDVLTLKWRWQHLLIGEESGAPASMVNVPMCAVVALVDDDRTHDVFVTAVESAELAEHIVTAHNSVIGAG